MVVTIYFKGKDATQAVAAFDLSLAEVVRLNNDFEGYQKTGKPTGGFYCYRRTDSLDPDAEPKSIHIDFEAILHID